MWLLLVIPIVLLVVLVVSLGAIFAGVLFVLGAAWPVLLIALGVWLFLHEDGRHARREHRGKRHRKEPSRPWAGHPQQPVGQPTKDGRPTSPSDAALLRKPELPIDMQVKVEQIRRKVDVLLSYADRFPPFSQDLYLVRQTASDYLPRTISAYLALPTQTVDKPVIADGKTPYQELKAQLELLDSKLDDIAQDLQRQDTDRMLANRRFLEDRFGTRQSQSKPVPDGRPEPSGVA